MVALETPYFGFSFSILTLVVDSHYLEAISYIVDGSVYPDVDGNVEGELQLSINRTGGC